MMRQEREELTTKDTKREGDSALGDTTNVAVLFFTFVPFVGSVVNLFFQP